MISPEKLTLTQKKSFSSNWMIPIGYWKGSALSIVSDLMAAIMSGGNSVHQIGKNETEYGLSQVMIAIVPAKSGPIGFNDDLINQVIYDIKSSAVDHADDKIFYPGEVEFLNREKSYQTGINLSDEVYKTLIKLSKNSNK